MSPKSPLVQNFIRSALSLLLLCFIFSSCSSNQTSASNPSDVAIELSSLYQNESDLNSAISTLEGFVAEYGESYDARANYNLTALYFATDRNEEGIGLAERSYTNFPAHVRFLHLEGRMLKKLERGEDYKKVLEKLLSLKQLNQEEIKDFYASLSDEEKTSDNSRALLNNIISTPSLWTKDCLDIAKNLSIILLDSETTEEINKIIAYAK